MQSILDYTLDDLIEFLSESKEKTFRADQVFDWVYRKKVFMPASMSNLPKAFREHLEKSMQPFPLKILKLVASRDGSRKALLECGDGLKIEAVSLPSEDGRTTFCLSTQVGCALGCVFCATGAMGFKRNLTAGEIISQVLLLESKSNRPSNLVLMGMGEGLLNFQEVEKFIKIISEPQGYALSERRITLSTAGLIPELMRFHEAHPKVEIAISLNASDSETRKKLMPHRKLTDFSEIMNTINSIDFDITLEYVLLENVNDTKKDASRLSKMIKIKNHVKVNLIRYNNAIRGFRAPDENKIMEFQNVLREAGIRCFIRKSLGDDINAACGQLSV